MPKKKPDLQFVLSDPVRVPPNKRSLKQRVEEAEAAISETQEALVLAMKAIIHDKAERDSALSKRLSGLITALHNANYDRMTPEEKRAAEKMDLP